MIRRFYVHNFRCLDNFSLNLAGLDSALLIGKNGSGKSTVGRALEVLQQVARGVNRVGKLVSESDFSWGRTDSPMRFELEVELEARVYHYVLALELPPGFNELRIYEEKLSAGDTPVFERNQAQVTLQRSRADARFQVDWHLVALPIVQESSERDPLAIFKRWLSRMLILDPLPQLIQGESEGDTLMPDRNVVNFAAWFTGLINHSPAAYSRLEKFLRDVMPDLVDIKNPLVGKNRRSLTIQFRQEQQSLTLSLEALSSGEKCYLICALAIAANQAYGPLFCFWDEADSHLHLSEVGQFILALRRSFQESSQLLITSHNQEAIRDFTEDSTLVLLRKSHLEPTQIRPLREFAVRGDLVSALVGDRLS